MSFRKTVLFLSIRKQVDDTKFEGVLLFDEELHVFRVFPFHLLHEGQLGGQVQVVVSPDEQARFQVLAAPVPAGWQRRVLDGHDTERLPAVRVVAQLRQHFVFPFATGKGNQQIGYNAHSQGI